MKGDRLRALMVGCGGIAAAWLDPLRSFADVEIAGLVDLKPENAARVKREFDLGRTPIGTSLEEMIASVRPDVVFDLTVPSAHSQVTITALSRGCHVLGEKPMSDTMENARLMTETARACGKVYAVIQNRRYLDGIVRFREAVRSGAIGPLTTLNADFYLGCHFGGFRDEMEHVLLVDMAIHSFDQARYISAADPRAVYCREWNPAGSWYRHGASAMAIFEMSNDVVFSYRGSWCAEGMNTSWQCAWRAVGEKGTIAWDGEAEIVGEAAVGTEGFTRKHAELSLPPLPPLAHTGHAGVIREFLDAVRNGTAPQTVCTDNIRSLAMVHGAVESAASGRRVAISF